MILTWFSNQRDFVFQLVIQMFPVFIVLIFGLLEPTKACMEWGMPSLLKKDIQFALSETPVKCHVLGTVTSTNISTLNVSLITLLVLFHCNYYFN